jgi:hypothetical protein
LGNNGKHPPKQNAVVYFFLYISLAFDERKQEAINVLCGRERRTQLVHYEENLVPFYRALNRKRFSHLGGIARRAHQNYIARI